MVLTTKEVSPVTEGLLKKIREENERLVSLWETWGWTWCRRNYCLPREVGRPCLTCEEQTRRYERWVQTCRESGW